MSRRQPDNVKSNLNRPRDRFQQTQHRNSRGNQQSETHFNPNASEFIPQGSNGNSSYHLGANPQNTSLSAVPSSFSGHDIYRNQSQNDTQGRYQNSAGPSQYAFPHSNGMIANNQQMPPLMSLPLQQNASGAVSHHPQQSDSGLQTLYQNNDTFNPNDASMLRVQQNVSNMVSHLGATPQNTSLPAVPSSYSGHNIYRNQSQSDTQGRFQTSAGPSQHAIPHSNNMVANNQQMSHLMSLPLQQRQVFGGGVILHNPQQSDSVYHTPYQNNGHFNPINTSMPREQQDVPVSGQPTNHVQPPLQFPIPNGGFPFPPPVIQVMSAQEFLTQHVFLWNEHAKALLEIARLRGEGVERPMESENNRPEVSPSRNVVDAETQTDIVTHRPGETQTDVTFKSVGVQYEEMSVSIGPQEEESPPVSTAEVFLPSNPPAHDSTKIQMAKDVISDLTSSVAVSIDSTPGATINDPVENGSGPSTNVTSKSSEAQEIASSLPVSVQHKEMSGATRHSQEEEAPLVSTTTGYLPSNSIVTTVTDTQNASEHRRAPTILIDFKSPKVLTFVSSQCMHDQCQDEYSTTEKKDRSLGVSPSKSYASVAAAVTGPVENTKLPTSSKFGIPSLTKTEKSGSNSNSVTPVKDTRNSAKNTMVPSTSGTFQWLKVQRNVSSTLRGFQSKNTSGNTRNRVQKKDKPVGRDVNSTSSNFETVANSTAGSSANFSFQPDTEPKLAVTSPDTQTQEESHLEVIQDIWIDEQGPLKSDQIPKILETESHPSDKEALIASLNESSLGEQKDQSEGNRMENSENIAPIQSKQPIKSPKRSKTAKKGKGGKASKQDKKNPHALEMGPDDEEELNRAIEDAKDEAIIRNGFQWFIQTRVNRYFDAMGSTRYHYLAFIKERPKSHEFMEAIMEYWKQNLSQLHNLDYHRSDKEIESLLNTRITRYSSSQDKDDWKLCLFFKLIFNKLKDPDTEVVALQDLLFLFNGNKSDFVQKSLDTRYYQMMSELDSWLPEDLGDPSMSATDLPPNSLDKFSITTLVIHINEQAKNRYLINKENPQITLASELVLSNAFQKVQEDKLDWSPDRTKELFQKRCKFWRNFENRNSDQSKFILYYELLASITSSVIDFDAYHLHESIQNIPKKDPERIWIEEMKFMCAVFSFVASDDKISKL
ncbi:hypothetical protein CRE_14791 [Caenorhabditis remanei]|uniref:Uncharacterized protein n=1 Tax=Caenorhabditis remanei TaxID=31234 RepID=E3MRQ7_CAERE|nr:hypothetical protein CRE_14791 [Caenorhabditis remanei]